jgi:hypothetical protein
MIVPGSYHLKYKSPLCGHNGYETPRHCNITFLPFLDQILAISPKIEIYTCDTRVKFLLSCFLACSSLRAAPP